jgi:AbrB family looped-hinge helix DNA binding protein
MHLEEHFLHGTTTVGERGQIVIPGNIRKALKIKPGDDMTVIARDGKIVVLPTRSLEAFYTSILDKLEGLRGKKRLHSKKR